MKCADVLGDLYLCNDCYEEAAEWYEMAIKAGLQREGIDNDLLRAREFAAEFRSGTFCLKSGPPGDGNRPLSRSDCQAYYRATRACIGKDDFPKQLLTRSDPWVKLIRSRWYSFKGDDDFSLREAFAVVDSAKRLRLDGADFFYLPALCWESVPLWERIHGQILTGTSIVTLGLWGWSTLDDVELSGSGRLIERSDANRMNIHMLVKRETLAVARFHMLRTQNKHESIKRMANKYSTWQLPKLACEFYETHRRMPMKDELCDLVDPL